MNIKYALIGILIAGVIIGGFILYQNQPWVDKDGDAVPTYTSGNWSGEITGPLHSEGIQIPTRPGDKQLGEIYDNALAQETILAKDHRDYEAYLTGALAWKSLADLTNNFIYYDLAADLYKQALIGYGDDFYVLWLNLGNVMNLAKKYDIAERAYRDGIKVFPKEPALYNALAEMSRYGMKKANTNVMKIYEDALNLQDGPPKEEIIAAYAPFLRDVGQNELALHYFRQLVKIYPNEALYKKQVEELEAKAGAGGSN